MARFVIPENLRQRLMADHGDEGRDWASRLPETVAALARRWSLRLDEPYEPGGYCSWVAPAETPDGRRLVLKAGWRHDEAASEADGLRTWAGRGAVVLHDSHVDGDTSALLLERCDPGTWLGMALPEPEQDVVIASLLRRLWPVPAPDTGFRPLQAMCDAWASGFERRLPEAPSPPDPGLARAGMELLRGLAADAGQTALLVTDLHAGNVLAAQREPWLVIDPKPYVGDPAFDCVQHMLNCHARLATDPIGLARRMAGLLDLDSERVTQWLFARCVQESIEQPGLGAVAIKLARA